MKRAIHELYSALDTTPQEPGLELVTIHERTKGPGYQITYIEAPQPETITGSWDDQPADQLAVITKPTSNWSERGWMRYPLRDAALPMAYPDWAERDGASEVEKTNPGSIVLASDAGLALFRELGADFVRDHFPNPVGVPVTSVGTDGRSNVWHIELAGKAYQLKTPDSMFVEALNAGQTGMTFPRTYHTPDYVLSFGRNAHLYELLAGMPEGANESSFNLKQPSVEYMAGKDFILEEIATGESLDMIWTRVQEALRIESYEKIWGQFPQTWDIWFKSFNAEMAQFDDMFFMAHRDEHGNLDHTIQRGSGNFGYGYWTMTGFDPENNKPNLQVANQATGGYGVTGAAAFDMVYQKEYSRYDHLKSQLAGSPQLEYLRTAIRNG